MIPSTAAELVGAIALVAFTLVVWPPAALLVVAALAFVYAWQNR